METHGKRKYFHLSGGGQCLETQLVSGAIHLKRPAGDDNERSPKGGFGCVGGLGLNGGGGGGRMGGDVRV